MLLNDKAVNAEDGVVSVVAEAVAEYKVDRTKEVEIGPEDKVSLVVRWAGRFRLEKWFKMRLMTLFL